MRTKDAVKHFGNRARIAKALGISRAAVHQWKAVVPGASAVKLQKITRGKLAVDPRLYKLGAAR